jgi:Transmembrane proteins 14C
MGLTGERNPGPSTSRTNSPTVSGRLMRPAGHRLAVVLFVMMGYRYATKGRKFMPSGLLALDSLVVLGVMILVMDWAV